MIKLLRTKGNASWIYKSLWSGLFVVILTFTFINMHSIISGVSVKGNIASIDSSTRVAKVVGVTKNANYVSLNGREIFIDKNGTFTETVALPEGLSFITLSAEDANGKTEEQNIEVVSPRNGENVAFNN